MPWSIRIFVSPVSTFQSFIFSSPALADPETNLTTDFTDPIWIKDRRPLPQIHPDPILSPSVVKNALVDPDLRFSSFYFPKFHLFLPCLVRFAPYAPLVAALRLEARGGTPHSILSFLSLSIHEMLLP